MNRRTFVAISTLGAAATTLAGAAETARKAPAPGHGACGLSCAGCRMYLNGKCPGCGKGMKAECAILTCAGMKGLAYCAQCKGYPCAKIKESGKFGQPWMDKIAQAPLPGA